MLIVRPFGRCVGESIMQQENMFYELCLKLRLYKSIQHYSYSQIYTGGTQYELLVPSHAIFSLRLANWFYNVHTA